MALKDRLNEQASNNSNAAQQTLADQIYSRWEAKMLESPNAKQWTFNDQTAGGEAVELVKRKFAAEGYTVTFRAARTGGWVEITEN